MEERSNRVGIDGPKRSVSRIPDFKPRWVRERARFAFFVPTPYTH